LKTWLSSKFPFFLVIFSILSLSCFNSISLAEEKTNSEFNFEALFDETLQTVEKANVNSAVFWIPQKFWEEIYSEKQGMSTANSELMNTVFEPYLIFMVTASVKNDSRFKNLKEKELVSLIKLVDKKGNTYTPLNKGQVNSTALSISYRMKSLFSKRMGRIGKGAVPIFFSAKDEKGRMIINTYKEGSFKVILGEAEFHWKLPLTSLAMPIKCPKCSKISNGTYRFCPYDGTKLNP